MARGKNTVPLTTNAKVDQYLMLRPMLDAVLAEMRELSKKKPDAILNKAKVEIVNRILQQVLGLLSDETSIGFLRILDDEQLPSNSDAVLMLTQFQAAMRLFEVRYRHRNELGDLMWFTRENPSGRA